MNFGITFSFTLFNFATNKLLNEHVNIYILKLLLEMKNAYYIILFFIFHQTLHVMENANSNIEMHCHFLHTALSFGILHFKLNLATHILPY